MRTIEDMVKAEVRANASILVEYCATHQDERDCPISFDDVAWYPALEWTDCSDEQIARAYNEQIDDNAGGPHDDAAAMVFALVDANLSPADCDIEGDLIEIVQWWSVSDWLAEKLREQGAVVVSDGYTEYWGRTCGGQAIADDSVICAVYASLHKVD